MCLLTNIFIRKEASGYIQYIILFIELANRQENVYLGMNLTHLNLPGQFNCHINLFDMGVCEFTAKLRCGGWGWVKLILKLNKFFFNHSVNSVDGVVSIGEGIFWSCSCLKFTITDFQIFPVIWEHLCYIFRALWFIQNINANWYSAILFWMTCQISLLFFHGSWNVLYVNWLPSES